MKLITNFARARAATFLGVLGFAAALNSHAATHTIEIVDFDFTPSSRTIQVGDTVTWHNGGGMTHTSTSGLNGTADGIWDSGGIVTGGSYSRVFDTAGTFPYFCEPHPFMTGTITVEGASALPVVTITSPANNASIPQPGNVKIEATASVEGGSIMMVEFFDGQTLLGMDHDEPYSFDAVLSTGAHSLTAKATSDANQTATSNPVTVTVQSGGVPITDPFPPIEKGDHTIELQTLAEGLTSPLGIATPDDGSDRLFIYDQAGKILIHQNGAIVETPLLDVGSRLVSLNPAYDERGLLGLAVHPNFAQNQLIYTYTSEPTAEMADFMIMPPSGSTNNHQSVIAEWKIDPANSNRVDVASRREIMRIDEPQSNHNAGTMHFGPDGFLYVTLGDGGAGDDQGLGHPTETGNGQDIETILGTVIRIDVDARTSANGKYGVPNDNPFVGKAGLDEIYAYGFRNPFSWSFDKLTGELYVADVGQNMIEELDRVFKGGNYGWRIKEGTFFFDPNGTANGFITDLPVTTVPGDLIDPIAEYDHSEGAAIVGGYVYRGTKIPGLRGLYVTGDWGLFNGPSGRLFYLDRSKFKEIRVGEDDRGLGMWIKGFGQDTSGELYVLGSTNLGPSGTSGKVLKLVPVNSQIELAATLQEDGKLNLEWTGGVGPFVVQTKAALESPVWRTVAASAAKSAAIPLDLQSGFLRVTDMAGNSAVPFTVALTGAAERPTPVTTSGSGSGTLSLEGNTLHFDIRYEGLSGPATMAHIHGSAAASAAAGILIDLAPYNGGGFDSAGTISGSVTLTPPQKAWLLEGKTYVNIHTANNGGGEIRGQILPVLYMAGLSGGAERPTPVNTSGSGSAIFLLTGKELSFNIAYSGLTGPATMAHIHGPAPVTAPASIMIDLGPFNGGAFGASGSLNGTVTLNDAQIAALADGLTYVNVHTAANGSGEIRGQILPQTTSIPLSASLSGLAERPTPVTDSPGTGLGIFSLEGNTLHFNVRYAGLKAAATMAHIHGPADAATAASIMIDLVPYSQGAFGTNGTLVGSLQVTDAQRELILQGRTYVNVHSSANGSGEIRGQIAPVLMKSVILGASERPAGVHQRGAKGQATWLLAGNKLTFNATYSGLSGAATMAHIHGPAAVNSAASIMIDLAPFNGGSFGAKGGFAGTKELTPDQLATLVDQLAYINIHTGAHGSGEIRGQIVR